MARNDVSKFYRDYFAKLQKAAERAVADALDDAFGDYFEQLEARIKEIFKEEIARFYGDYTPIVYERGYSMFHLLKTKVTKKPAALKIWFDPSEMSSFRDSELSGDALQHGLYNQVFRKGWHGGADKISSDKEEKYGRHPEPGVPYWRIPVPYYHVGWGQRAKVADEAPLTAIKRRIAEYQATQSQSDFDEIWARRVNAIDIRRYL